MIFNNITREKKIEMLTDARVGHEENIYNSILKIGLDPDEFNAESFDPDDNLHPENNEVLLQGIAKSINFLNIIDREIASLEV